MFHTHLRPALRDGDEGEVASHSLQVVGCREVDALAFDSSLDRPSVVAAPVTPGAHTVVLLNLGPEADTLSYRIEIN